MPRRAATRWDASKFPAAPRRPFRMVERDESRRSPKRLGAVMHETADPPAEAIAAAIDRLGSRGYSEVMLERGEGADRTALCVGGGQEDRVSCWAARADDPRWDQTFVYLVDEHASGETTLILGGQASDLPLRLCVPRAWAHAAAKRFAKDGKLDPKLPWAPVD